MQQPVNSWQQAIYDLCFATGLVEPKRIEFRLHKAVNYLSDICRRDRVDPFSVCNAILLEIEPLARTDPARFFAVANRIFSLLCVGTQWAHTWVDPQAPCRLKYRELCRHTGVLLEDLGGAMTALAAVEDDGRIDASDDAGISEFLAKAQSLKRHLDSVSVELQRRRAQSEPQARARGQEPNP
jgi:hypothetical protein